MYDISFGAARISKYASRESGDSLDVVERPNGGLCAVLSDGQGSGKAAHTLSSLVTARALALVKEGGRDEAAALAANDYLLATKHGQVSATLVMITVDPVAQLVTIARNTTCPVYIVRPVPPPEEDPANPLDPDAAAILSSIDEGIIDHRESGAGEPFIGGNPLLQTTATALVEAPAEAADPVETLSLVEPAVALGLYHDARPAMLELPLVAPLYVVAFTDGIQTAGERYQNVFDLPALVAERIAGPIRAFLTDATSVLPAPDALADHMLAEALRLDKGRAADDMSVVVLRVAASALADGAPLPRRLSISAVVS